MLVLKLRDSKPGLLERDSKITGLALMYRPVRGTPGGSFCQPRIAYLFASYHLSRSVLTMTWPIPFRATKPRYGWRFGWRAIFFSGQRKAGSGLQLAPRTRLKLVDRPGLEPGTHGLKVRC